MPNFCANLTTQFNEVSFLERFERAHAAGFTAVEFMFPYEWDKQELAAKLEKCHLKQVLFNLPAGNWTAGNGVLPACPTASPSFNRAWVQPLNMQKRSIAAR